MKILQNVSDLRRTIQALEVQSIAQKQLLKLQLKDTIEGLRPINLIGDTIKEAFKSKDFNGSIVKSGVGFLASRILPGGPLAGFLISNALEWGTTKLTKPNAESGKLPIEIMTGKLGGFLGNIFRKKNAMN